MRAGSGAGGGCRDRYSPAHIRRERAPWYSGPIGPTAAPAASRGARRWPHVHPVRGRSPGSSIGLLTGGSADAAGRSSLPLGAAHRGRHGRPGAALLEPARRRHRPRRAVRLRRLERRRAGRRLAQPGHPGPAARAHRRRRQPRGDRGQPRLHAGQPGRARSRSGGRRTTATRTAASSTTSSSAR